MEFRRKIIVILGPTSSGKSDIAIKLAKKYNGEIISADSRQIYSGMNIGTGKIARDFSVPSSKFKVQSSKFNIYWNSSIPHYMIDIVSPKTDYNVAKFKKRAEKIIEDVLHRGKLPIICGGTGFWIKAIVDNVKFPEVKPNKELRNKLRNYSAERLYKMLKKIDLQRAENIDRHNKVRLIRAIEIAKALGKVPTADELKRLGLPASPAGGSRPQRPKEAEPLKFLQIGIKLPKEKLHQNIKKRLEARFKQGMIKEVKNLYYKEKLGWKKIQSFGLGYFWIPLYLQGKLTKQEVFEKIYAAEKDYAKRQMTWFKKDIRIKWLKNYLEIEKRVKSFIKK